MEIPKGMVSFDIERAKRGEKVVTRGGHPVRIICFDRIGERPIVYLYISPITQQEQIEDVFISGSVYRDTTSACDIFHPEPEMWVNVYKRKVAGDVGGLIFPSKEEARKSATDINCIGTFKLVKE